jgi:hypothetical protein
VRIRFVGGPLADEARDVPSPLPGIVYAEWPYEPLAVNLFEEPVRELERPKVETYYLRRSRWGDDFYVAASCVESA